MKYITFLICLVSIVSLVSCGGEKRKKCKVLGENQFCDQRTGSAYKYVKIGNQTWMAENLEIKRKSNICYGNKKSNCNMYGRLYDWKYAITTNKTKKSNSPICPVGWHLPNRNEWNKLIEFGIENVNFLQLGGYKLNYKEKFVGIGNSGGWWSLDESDSKNAIAFIFDQNSKNFVEFNASKSSFFSVRCVKDGNEIILPPSSSSTASSSSIATSSSSTTSPPPPAFIWKDSMDTKTIKKYIESYHNNVYGKKLGDGKMLKGHIHLIPIFVETPTHKWNLEDVFKVFNQQSWAIGWINYQAYKYGIPLGFSYNHLSEDIHALADEIPNNWRKENWLDNAAQKFIIEDKKLNVLIEKLRDSLQTQNIRVVVYTTTPGRSYAWSHNQNEDATSLNSSTLVFCGNGLDNIGTTIAHELLHLFAADDLYESKDGSGVPSKYTADGKKGGTLKPLIAKNVENDIMNNSYKPWKNLEISSLTACLLGWEKEPKEWYKSSLNECRKEK